MLGIRPIVAVSFVVAAFALAHVSYDRGNEIEDGVGGDAVSNRYEADGPFSVLAPSEKLNGGDPSRMDRETPPQTPKRVHSFQGAPGTITGRVVDAVSGEFLPDILVYAKFWQTDIYLSGYRGKATRWAEATSDQSGNFTLSALPPNHYEIVIDDPLYLLAESPIVCTILDAGELSGIRVPVARGGSVEGLVTIEGRPVANQPVSLKYAGVRNAPTRTLSDESGYYAFTGLDEGVVEVKTVFDDGIGKIPFMLPSTIELGAINVANLEFDRQDSVIEGYVVGMEDAGSCEVVATGDSASGPPRTYYATVFPDGYYVMDGLPYGKYELHAYMDEYGDQRSTIRTLVEALPDRITHHDFFVTPYVELTGFIENADPAQDVEIIAKKNCALASLSRDMFQYVQRISTTYYAEVEPDGTFRFANLESGVYTILAFDATRRGAMATVRVDTTREPALESIDELHIAIRLMPQPLR